MKDVRLSFPVYHNDEDKETLESIFTFLKDVFGESVFYDTYDVMVYGSTFAQLVKCIKSSKNHEKKH